MGTGFTGCGSSGIREPKMRTWFFGKQEAEVMEVEDCRKPPREGGRLMGVNQGTAEVRWNLWVFLC